MTVLIPSAPPRRGAAIIGLALAGLALLPTPSPAQATRPSRASAATTEIHFNLPLLRALGIDVTGLPRDEGRDSSYRHSARFEARAGDALELLYAEGVFLGIGPGALRYGNGFVLALDNGERIDLREFEIVAAKPPGTFEIRTAQGQTAFVVESVHLMFDSDRSRVLFRNADMKISSWLAGRAGKPRLIGQTVAGFDLLARFEEGPQSVAAACDVDLVSPVDVELTTISDFDQVSRQAGVLVTMAASATLFNNGPGTVEWYRAIVPDGVVGAHPFLAQQLYRLDPDGTFRQIGLADVKHAFYAVNSGCSCSGGQLLFAGCGDTYGISNNSDRKFFAPREEVSVHPESWPSRWAVAGSHFDGFGVDPPDDTDSVRSHDREDHDAFEHLLTAAESDLETAGARFFVEVWYATARDSSVWNNIGYREIVPDFSGSSWSFGLLGDGVVSGPAVDAWVDPVTPPAGSLSTTLDTVDGRLRLASRATDLGGGSYRYDYVLFNLDFDRKVDRFTVPAGGVTGTLFRGAGSLPSAPWGATAGAHQVEWQAAAEDALDWATTFGFSFISTLPPGRTGATVHALESGAEAEFKADAIVPVLFADDFETGDTTRWSETLNN